MFVKTERSEKTKNPEKSKNKVNRIKVRKSFAYVC
jgi:hypothetical protein